MGSKKKEGIYRGANFPKSKKSVGYDYDGTGGAGSFAGGAAGSMDGFGSHKPYIGFRTKDN